MYAMCKFSRHTQRLESTKPFILLLGYTEVSPKYKGYSLFWEAILRMPEAFKEGMAVLVIGVWVGGWMHGWGDGGVCV